MKVSFTASVSFTSLTQPDLAGATETRKVSRRLVASCHDDTIFRRLSRHHVDARIALVIAKGDAPYGCLGVCLDLGFGLFRSVPWTEEEASVFDARLELVVIVARIYMTVKEVLGFLEDILLNFFKQASYALLDTVERYDLLFKRVAAHELDGSAGHVAKRTGTPFSS